MSLRRILTIVVISGFCSMCTTSPQKAEVEPTTSTSSTPIESPAPKENEVPNVAPAPVDTDTVESLSKDVDGLQRDLIQYAGPLTPKQESEVESLKKKIDNKESKKAKLELQKMLGDWKEEE